MKLWIIQTSDLIPSDPISRKTILPIIRPQNARSGNAHQLYSGPGQLVLAEYEHILQHVSKKVLSELEKR